MAVYFPFEMGTDGAAFAATLGLFVGGAFGLLYLFGFANKLGSSTLLTEAMLATLIFVGNHVFMKYLDDDGVGACGITCYYIPFVFMVGNAIAQSVQPIISYNFGLGDRKCRQRLPSPLLTVSGL